MSKIPNPLPVRVEADSKETDRYAEEKDYRSKMLVTAQRLNKITAGGAIVGLLGLAAVWATITLSREQFAKDHRPYIWITNPVFDAAQANNKLTGRITVKNIGKSPALNVHRDFSQIYFGPHALENAYQFFDGLEKVKIDYEGHQSAPLTPENWEDKDTFLTTQLDSFVALKPEDADWANLHKDSVMAGFIHYTDPEGRHYWTEYCVRQYDKGDVGPCGAHNEIH